MVISGRLSAWSGLGVQRLETAPSGDVFETELLQNGNKLRERGSIGRFYREASVSEGDYVVLTETSPGNWALEKALVS